MRIFQIASIVAIVGLLAACGGRSATVQSEQTGPAPAPGGGAAAPGTTVPVNTTMQVRLEERIGTEDSKVGDTFTATVTQDVRGAGGGVLIPSGAEVIGEVTGLKESGGRGEQAAIRVDFERVTFGGETHPMGAEVASTSVQTDREASEVAAGTGIGTVAGAALGAVIGGEEGAVIGGALGAGTGTVIGLGEGDVDAAIPAGSTMTLRTTSPINI